MKIKVMARILLFDEKCFKNLNTYFCYKYLLKLKLYFNGKCFLFLILEEKSCIRFNVTILMYLCVSLY